MFVKLRPALIELRSVAWADRQSFNMAIVHLVITLVCLLDRLLPAEAIPSRFEKNARAIDCNSSSADFDTSCWATLDLTNWLTAWRPPTICPGTDTTNCCASDEEWSSCFLKFAIGPGFNCTTISAGTCAFTEISAGVPSNIQPQVRYIAENVFCKDIQAVSYLQHCFL